MKDLKSSLRGRLIEPNDPAYEEARALYNGMIDKRPAAIARCIDVADVMAAVSFGRDSSLPVAIRRGGHNGPGLGRVNDGLVIDLSQMKGVRVDPAARTARVAAGCTQGDVDHGTHAFGLAVPAGIISTTGIAGLTLMYGPGDGAGHRPDYLQRHWRCVAREIGELGLWSRTNVSGLWVELMGSWPSWI